MKYVFVSLHIIMLVLHRPFFVGGGGRRIISFCSPR